MTEFLALLTGLSGEHWEIFPVNGLDRSLHAPVFIGLLVLTFYAEAFGWTYAGLVVPGYFASVIVAAPVTAVLVVIESVLAYLLAALVGRWLPRFGVWSTSFGRERFFLLIITATLVRLSVEGNLVPLLLEHYEIPHSRELYSLGLVLVPLVANTFWNVGMRVALPRIATVTLITYLVVEFVLLRHTNFTVSRFQIANENVSLQFLESPHAQIILILGALLAARSNVLYGWDYNGILVPALLAVAWYQPTKLLTTLVEALLVYWVSRAITRVPPLSHLLIVGSRRVVVVFTVGFVLKFVLGFVVARFAPQVQMIDYFGFGYLLPTLLGVKIWNKDSIGPVLMPTLQVSIIAFFVGNGVGFALAELSGHNTEDRAQVSPIQHAVVPASLELVLGDLAPRPERVGPEDQGAPGRAALLALQHLIKDGTIDNGVDSALKRAQLRLTEAPGSAGAWFVLRPFSTDPDADLIAPRCALRVERTGTRPLLIEVETDSPGSPVAVVAERIAAVTQARVMVLHSKKRYVGTHDSAFASSLLQFAGIEAVIRLRLGDAERLVAYGGVARGLDIVGIGEALELTLPIEWGVAQKDEELPLIAQLDVTRAQAEAIAAKTLDLGEIEQWSGGIAGALSERIDALTTVGLGQYAPPSVEEMRLFSAALEPALRRLARGGEPSNWERALATALGYRFARIGPLQREQPQGWALFEPSRSGRRGHATLVYRVELAASATPAILVQTPAVRWEVGTYAAAMALFTGIRASAVLVPGALPGDAPQGRSDPRRPAGRRSYYQLAHQLWLDAGGRAVSVNGIVAERVGEDDVVLSLGKEQASAAELPLWVQPIRRFWVDAGARVGTFDGTLLRAPFEGAGDPALAYALGFAENQMVLSWLTPALRRRFVSVQEDTSLEGRLKRAEAEVRDDDVAERAFGLAECSKSVVQAPPPEGCAVLWRAPLSFAAACEHGQLANKFELYTARRDPYALLAALKGAPGCHLELVRDWVGGLTWAVIAGSGQSWVVPLKGGPAARSLSWYRAPEAVRQALATGLATVRVEAN